MGNEELPSTPTLSGLHLTRSFVEGQRSKLVLDDVSLHLEPGQIALLMGPSGSGKSTLLAILSGLLRPDDGDVIALGQSLWGLSERQRERFRLKNCGFVFQGFNLFSALTARQHLEMVLRWGEGCRSREARDRADEMLAKLGLGEMAERRPSQLSGGEKQRVAIGRALIKNPKFCFADEPTSALDWENGLKVVQLLEHAAHEEKATVLIVAHDERIKPYVDKVFYMEDGRLRDEGAAMTNHVAPPKSAGLAGARVTR